MKNRHQLRETIQVALGAGLAEHRTVSNLGQKTLKLDLAKWEPSTQDIRKRRNGN